MLVVDAERRPQGWLAIDSTSRLDGSVTPDLLNLGGTLAPESGTLREALDSALSSPSGRGVVITEDGRFAGTITAVQVLERIDQQANATRLNAQHAAAARAAGEASP